MVEEFIRTTSGLANTHLFHAADIIVYCEAHPDTPEDMSWDMGFWGKLLSYFAPDKSYVFKPLGGKTTVLAIADRLTGVGGHRSLCLVDRDFDDIHEVTHEAPFLIQTYGYAFENDLCDPLVIGSAVDFLLPGTSDLRAIRREVNLERRKAEASFRWAVVADVLLSFYYQGFFDRDAKKYKAVCNFKGAIGLAKLCPVKARNRFQAQRASISAIRPVSNPVFQIDTWRRMLGHLCWWINFRIAYSILASKGFKDRLVEDVFAATCLNFFAIKLAEPDWHIAGYYSQRIPAAIAAGA